MVEGVSGTLAGSISLESPCKREGGEGERGLVGVGFSTETTGNELSCLLLPIFYHPHRAVDTKVALLRGLLCLLVVFCWARLSLISWASAIT